MGLRYEGIEDFLVGPVNIADVSGGNVNLPLDIVPFRAGLVGVRSVVKTSFTGGTDITFQLKVGSVNVSQKWIHQTADANGVVRSASGVEGFEIKAGDQVILATTENGAVTAGSIGLWLLLHKREPGRIYQNIPSD